jgi:hypothetical protein
MQNIKKKLDEVNNKYIKELKENEKLKKEKEELENHNKIFSENILEKENSFLGFLGSEKKINLLTERNISQTIKGKEIIQEFEHIFNGTEENINNHLKESLKNKFSIDDFQIENSQFEIENNLKNKNDNIIDNNNIIESINKKDKNDEITNEFLNIENTNFEILTEQDITINNFITKTFSFLSQEEYNDVQKLLLLTYKALNLRNRDIENQFDSNENNKSIIFFQICKLFKINDNSLIERFMLSLSKSHKGFDFDKLRDNFIKIFKNKFELDEHITIKKFIKELIEKVSFIFQTTTQAIIIGFLLYHLL